jgi:hypothetical protein
VRTFPHRRGRHDTPMAGTAQHHASLDDAGRPWREAMSQCALLCIRSMDAAAPTRMIGVREKREQNLRRQPAPHTKIPDTPTEKTFLFWIKSSPFAFVSSFLRLDSVPSVSFVAVPSVSFVAVPSVPSVAVPSVPFVPRDTSPDRR